MELVYRGSVNRWECDENDHMNVRFYVERHQQILQGGLLMKGAADPARVQAMANSVHTHHLRFLAESRLSAPLSGYFGQVRLADGTLRVCTELRHSRTGQVLCSCLHSLPDEIEVDVPATPVESWQGSRGLADKDSIYDSQPVDNVEDIGFKLIGAGVVQEQETSAVSELHVHHYMGRISDAMPHLWAHLRGDELDDGGGDEGGAVLEYRLRYHGLLRAGDHFRVFGGCASLQGKVQKFVHLLFDAEGRLMVSAQTAGVRMNLTTRKAMTPDAATVARMQPLLLHDIGELEGVT